MSGEEPPDERRMSAATTNGTALIFDWQPGRWRGVRLAVALGVAALGHVLVFYLFQVVSETAPRQAPPQRQVTLLPTGVAATRRLMEGLDDRFPARSGAVPLVGAEEVPLESLVKGYHPTWQDHLAALKPLPGAGLGGALPSLLDGPGALLPELPVGKEAGPRAREVGVGTRALPAVSFQSGLGKRRLLGPPEWPEAVRAEEWPEEGSASFLMSVDAEGQVASCLSLGASAGLDEEVLRGALMKLRFGVREDAEDLEWGWVDVLW